MFHPVSIAIKKSPGDHEGLADFSPEIETLSLDAAFLDMTGSEQLFGDSQSIGRRLKEAVPPSHERPDSIRWHFGNQIRSQSPSARRKPDGLTVVRPEEAKAWLAIPFS